MDEKRNQVLNKKIWISIDKTTDTEGRYIANVIIGTLLADKSGKIFLLASEVLEKANHTTISYYLLIPFFFVVNWNKTQ